jgi:ABC-type sugar transport system substrate-binding protein
MRLRLLATVVTFASIALIVAGCSSPPSASSSLVAAPQSTATANGAAMASTLAYIKAGLPNLKGASIAYLAECASQNAYCQTRWTAAQKAAKDLGAKATLFDAGFDTAKQLSQTQDAIQRGFDGYVLAPVADAPGCANFKLLQATGKPIVNINSPMCGNTDYTKGTVGFVGIQTQSFFRQHAENAFASCKGTCNALALGGSVGSDLFTRWDNAIKEAAAKYPNVHIVSQPSDFDPAKALSITQDTLSSTPDLQMVLCGWDDATRGVEQAILAAGEKPGKDVRIYSAGASAAGVAKVIAGTWNETSIELPYEESYYGFAELAKAMATGKSTPGFTDLAQSPVVVNGPGSIFVQANNAANFTPEY